MNDWWEAFWFFLPAGIANMSPVIAMHLPRIKDWRTPIDFGRSWHGKRIFGKNKTWRGLLFGTFMAAVVGLLQYRFIGTNPESTGFIIAATAAMGCGALVGDAVESFFKRQAGIPSGHSWFPFDQTDYIIGGLLFVYLFVPLTASQILRIFILYFGLHVVTSYIAYQLKLKDKPI